MREDHRSPTVEAAEALERMRPESYDDGYRDHGFTSDDARFEAEMTAQRERQLEAARARGEYVPTLWETVVAIDLTSKTGVPASCTKPGIFVLAPGAKIDAVVEALSERPEFEAKAAGPRVWIRVDPDYLQRLSTPPF